MPMLEGQIQPWGRVSRTLSGTTPPPHKANFSSLDIVQVRVSRTLSGLGYLGYCLGYPPPLQSKFFQLGHCPGQGISDIVQVRVSQTLSGIPPPLAQP